jgi:outer membrane protein assembly factor BamD
MRRIAVLALAALAACSSKHTTFTGELKLKTSADDNYQAGLDELKADHYDEAIKFFQYVKTKYPFSHFAALSDLRIADAKFAQEHFLEAADGYAQFQKLHPGNAEIDYARYRQGVAHFRDAPGDFFLFPPAQEKDQRQTEKAVEVLAKLLEDKPDSKYAEEARKELKAAQTRLSEREWYVAEFYYKRERWAGAAGRYRLLVDKYPGTAHEGEALFKLADSYVHLSEKYQARVALQQLIVKHPDDPRHAEAEKLLASIR